MPVDMPDLSHRRPSVAGDVSWQCECGALIVGDASNATLCPARVAVWGAEQRAAGAAEERARLRAIEGLKDVPDNFTFGDVWVDLRRRILLRGSDPEYRLTTHEAGVLGYLIAHRGRDVTREELLEKVWGYAPTMQTRTVDNQILKLRKKVEEEPADPRHILTIHGKGYRFEE